MKQLTDEQILHLVDTHVGGPTPSYPLGNNDWINFARAVEYATQSAPLTDSYVQHVPDKCDRITWRNRYYHLPLEQAQPERAPLIPCRCFDEVSKRLCINKNKCVRIEAHGINQGGQQ